MQEIILGMTIAEHILQIATEECHLKKQTLGMDRMGTCKVAYHRYRLPVCNDKIA